MTIEVVGLFIFGMVLAFAGVIWLARANARANERRRKIEADLEQHERMEEAGDRARRDGAARRLREGRF